MTVLFCMSWKLETKTNDVSGIIADISKLSHVIGHGDLSLTTEYIQGSTHLEPSEA